MERFDVHIRSLERPLEQAPEVLKPVRVDVAACIAFQMINNLAVVIVLQGVVRHERVGANGRTFQNVFAHVTAQFRPSRVGNYFQNHARRFLALGTLKNALHCCFLDSRIAHASEGLCMKRDMSGGFGFVVEC